MRKYLPLVALSALFSLASPAQVAAPSVQAAQELVHRFQASWVRFYGVHAPLPDGFSPPEGLSPEETFDAMWSPCEAALLPPDREPARDALRLRVLGDETPTLAALHAVISRGRLNFADLRGSLVYRFLDEMVEDGSFLHQVLPPGAQPLKLRLALRERGMRLPDFQARFLAWVFVKAREAGLLEGSSITPPAIWALDGGLEGGAFAAVSLPEAFLGGWTLAEVAGDVDPRIRVFTFFSDAQGRPIRTALAPVAQGRVVLCGSQERAFVVLFNPERVPVSLGGLAVTFWNGWDLPFSLRGSSADSGGCDIALEESGGMASYGIWQEEAGEEPLRRLTAEFFSDGPGLHRYRLPWVGDAPSPGGALRLVGRTTIGGEVVVGLPGSEVNRNSESAP